MYNNNPGWRPSTSWLWNPTVEVFQSYYTLVGLSSSVGQTHIIDLDGNIRWAKYGKILTKETVANVIDELL